MATYPYVSSRFDTLLTFVSRESWGARAPKGVTRHEPNTITVHHFASGPLRNWRGAETMVAVQRDHMDNQGWQDIGYHWVIAPDGGIWQGRPEAFVGSHVANKNTGNIGVSLYGTLNTSGEDPTAAQITSLKSLLSDIARRHNISVSRILTHGEQQDNKDCPGSRVIARLPEVKEYVQQQLWSTPGIEAPPAYTPVVTSSLIDTSALLPGSSAYTPPPPPPPAPAADEYQLAPPAQNGGGSDYENLIWALVVALVLGAGVAVVMSD